MQYTIFDYEKLAELSKEFETPCYIYDTQLLQSTIAQAQAAAEAHLKYPHQIHYALKANDHPQLLQLIQKTGVGIDCVSGGEMEKALHAGFAPQQMVFAGVGKQDWEIVLGINSGIHAFNCESLQELEVINALSCERKLVAPVMLRINPDIDAKTHKHITTGNYANKFGSQFEDVVSYLPRLQMLKNIKLLGLHYHIGSQIRDMQVFAKLAQTVTTHYKIFAKHGYPMRELDLGGGLGVDYVNPKLNPIPDFNAYFATINQHLGVPSATKIHFELGRSLVAQSGILLGTVLFTKTTAGTKFAILDAGMNDFMRPALYDAIQNIVVISQKHASDNILPYHVVGPVCESTDIFAKDVVLPELQRGDKVIIETSGAYGRVLASQYNSRKLVQEYCI